MPSIWACLQPQGTQRGGGGVEEGGEGAEGLHLDVDLRLRFFPCHLRPLFLARGGAQRRGRCVLSGCLLPVTSESHQQRRSIWCPAPPLPLLKFLQDILNLLLDDERLGKVQEGFRAGYWPQFAPALRLLIRARLLPPFVECDRPDTGPQLLRFIGHRPSQPEACPVCEQFGSSQQPPDRRHVEVRKLAGSRRCRQNKPLPRS